MELIHAWLLSFMVMMAPPGRHLWIPGTEETKDDATARYESIATDIEEVIFDETPVFKGSTGHLRTAALIMSMMLHESAFRKDVDTGVGPHARGDHGRSWCLMQLNVGTGRTHAWNTVKRRFAAPSDPPDEVEQGWTGEEMVTDRKNCIRAGLRMVNGTLCRQLPVVEWLRSYASGSCDNGSEESQRRVGLAIRWFSSHPPGITDADIIEEREAAAKRRTLVPEPLEKVSFTFPDFSDLLD